ncbi:MAG: hypothetical protein R3250_16895, partial [Melioribacteraceae bacterium]|nr:hypothetical protein [Melioribacteraceae bacterium]
MFKKISILFLFFSGLVLGDGWTKKAGSGYYAIDMRLLNASKYHNSSGDNIDINSVMDLAFNLYSEYGLTDELTLKLNFPFYKILDYDMPENGQVNNLDLDNSGIGDLDLGMRYKVAKFGNTVLAVGLTFGIPISTDDVYGAENKFALSDGEFNQIIGLEAGHSLYPFPGYVSGSIKYNNRNEGYSDQFYAGVETGYNVKKNLLLNLRFNYLKSLKNGSKEVIENVIPIQANNQEYLALKFG